MAPEPYVHIGSSALSEYRRKSLASKLGVSSISARYIHYVGLNAPLSVAEKAKLDFLLSYEDVPASDAGAVEGETHRLYVLPRKGTISPWSSKATSIAQVCLHQLSVKRIERGITFCISLKDSSIEDFSLKSLDDLHDRMTQTVSQTQPNPSSIFLEEAPASATVVPILKAADPRKALQDAIKSHGLGLDAAEIEYLSKSYQTLGRDPYLEEIFMFGQIQSEHCRHKTFNACWTIDGNQKVDTLFGLIRQTHKKSPQHVRSAYSDNAAVLEGVEGEHLAPDHVSGVWKATKERVDYLAKVETHNHPTAVSPFPGAATGVGGAMRDDASVGRGSRPKTGLCGYCVSDLLIPGHEKPYEVDARKPAHIASSLDIMLQAPIGAASYNNEFGRPCTAGTFRTLTKRGHKKSDVKQYYGFHKPVMLAGGVGQIRPQMALKRPEIVPQGAITCVIGGPAMLIGLGGGSASSVASSDASVDLDFASVQRGNAEVQRRAQEVITACNSLGTDSPILFIHDVGAGGLSNALPELAKDSNRGANFELRNIDNADKSMSPLQIWSCEAQERYVAAIAPEKLDTFKAIAERERCGYSLVGETTEEYAGEGSSTRLILMDRDSTDHPTPIDLPMSVLFEMDTKIQKTSYTQECHFSSFDSTLSTYLPEAPEGGLLSEAVDRVLSLPAVGSKNFLITIGDRSVGGLTTRDQLVGPWSTPVSDVAVAATSLTPGMRTGEATALGEKPNLALIDAGASVRMAIAEALLNLSAACLQDRLSKVILSANWMSAASHEGEGAALYKGVQAVSTLCQDLGICIPVGKDSVSMKMKWTDKDTKEVIEVISPLTLDVTAVALVNDITKTWTPALRRYEDVGETIILFVDLAQGRKALGGSALAQAFEQVGDVAPDLHDIQLLKDYFDAVEQLQEAGIVLAYHDRSDGGLFTSIVEMMFAGRSGMEIMLDNLAASTQTKDVVETLFNEELGAIFQIRKQDEHEFIKAFATCGPPPGLINKIGRVPPSTKQDLAIYRGSNLVYRGGRATLQQQWAATSYHLQRIRDNPDCADAEYATLLDDDDPGLTYNLKFTPTATPSNPLLKSVSSFLSNLSLNPLAAKPPVAILREQGINGQNEMAFAFLHAGFTPVDVHMTDLISGRRSLSDFVGLAACGGFSYGDVLGAGQGWAKSVLLHPSVRADFQTFFTRPNTFTLGVCNGCQFLTRLRQLIPGTEAWPVFERNTSEQYEARNCMVEIIDRPAKQGSTYRPNIFFQDMDTSSLPISVAHGEGRATFSGETSVERVLEQGLVAMRYLTNDLKPAGPEAYPFNPNGSPEGIAGVRSEDGRVLALMPHPERTILGGVGSYIPPAIASEWKTFGPWMRVFENARKWVG